MRSWLLVVALCALVACGLGFVKYRQIQAGIAFAASFPEPVESIETFVVEPAVLAPTSLVTGTLVATRSITLTNELAGTIVAVGFAPGARVEAGQRLLELDTREETAARAAAAAEAEIARLDLVRSERLIKRGAIAPETVERHRAAFDAASAAVARLDAVIARKTLRAPFAAQTDLHEWDVGQYLDAGAPVTRLVAVDDALWIDFTLPQDAPLLVMGTRVSLSGNDRQIEAVLVSRDAAVDRHSRNLRYRARVAHDDLLAAGLPPEPGALVALSVPVGGGDGSATQVPVTAVRRNSFGARVFLLEPAQPNGPAQKGWRARERAVELGGQVGEMLIVKSGLIPGDIIAATGAFKLRDGVLVRPVEATPVEATPVEATPVEATPVEAMPVEATK
jgi:membrane fusion protein (multidrug efflux system)